MVFVSITGRVLINLEALNMVESVGNVVRHRRAPIIIPTDQGYIQAYVPVISGECLAHAFQVNLAKLADGEGLPVCKFCRQGIFLKHAEANVFNVLYGQNFSGRNVDQQIGNYCARQLGWSTDNLTNVHRICATEFFVIRNCVVEDVGGFLQTETTTKRTSCIQFGYMVPAYDMVEKIALEPQFHVRYHYDPKQHAPFYIETGSSLYVYYVNFELDRVARLSNIVNDLVRLDENDGQKKRVELAMRALYRTLCLFDFGAHRSRNLPHVQTEAIIALLCKGSDRLSVVPLHKDVKKTLKEVINLVKNYISLFSVDKEKIVIYVYPKVETEESDLVIKKCGSPHELYQKLIQDSCKALPTVTPKTPADIKQSIDQLLESAEGRGRGRRTRG